ncbi:potassium efflux protein KefA [Actinobacillus equuli]|nr:potassium efflux protein KefA [Actinobacillus equuli]
MLEGLAQAQRNIEEQISALQGTLVLSKVINQQMQALPTAKLNNDLATSIANVRVHILNIRSSEINYIILMSMYEILR